MSANARNRKFAIQVHLTLDQIDALDQMSNDTQQSRAAIIRYGVDALRSLYDDPESGIHKELRKYV